jgi:hypothetical protein
MVVGMRGGYSAAILNPAAFGVTMFGMSEFEPVPDGEVVEADEIDGLPVIAEVREVEPVAASRIGAVQAAAVAATSFAAGAATLALARRLGARKLAGMQQELVRRPSLDMFGPGETRTYVVHVRTIRRSWD